jgi:hypothetical protein
MVTLKVRLGAGTERVWIVGAFKARLLAYFFSATRASSIPRRAIEQIAVRHFSKP